MPATQRKTAPRKLSPKEAILTKAGLLPKKLTPAQRVKLGRLSTDDAKALARVKRNTGYAGTLVIRGFFF